MDLDTFTNEYPSLRGVLLRGQHVPRKRQIRQLVENFEKQRWAISPTGATADVLLCWMRENGQSYRLLYHAGFRCFIVTRESDTAIEAFQLQITT